MNLKWQRTKLFPQEDILVEQPLKNNEPFSSPVGPQDVYVTPPVSSRYILAAEDYPFCLVLYVDLLLVQTRATPR